VELHGRGCPAYLEKITFPHLLAVSFSHRHPFSRGGRAAFLYERKYFPSHSLLSAGPDSRNYSLLVMVRRRDPVFFSRTASPLGFFRTLQSSMVKVGTTGSSTASFPSSWEASLTQRNRFLSCPLAACDRRFSAYKHRPPLEFSPSINCFCVVLPSPFPHARRFSHASDVPFFFFLRFTFLKRHLAASCRFRKSVLPGPHDFFFLPPPELPPFPPTGGLHFGPLYIRFWRDFFFSRIAFFLVRPGSFDSRSLFMRIYSSSLSGRVSLPPFFQCSRTSLLRTARAGLFCGSFFFRLAPLIESPSLPPPLADCGSFPSSRARRTKPSPFAASRRQFPRDFSPFSPGTLSFSFRKGDGRFSTPYPDVPFSGKHLLFSLRGLLLSVTVVSNHGYSLLLSSFS